MIYFDHNATTYLRPEVIEAMLPFFKEKFGNVNCRDLTGLNMKKKEDLKEIETILLAGVQK